MPDRDAEAVALLRAAGAIPFAKTNVPFAASDHQSYNPVYGTTSGPMARTAADLELMLDVIAAPAEKDRHAWSVRVPPSRHERIADFRVALWADDEHFSLDSRCRDAIHGYADDLRRLGAQVEVARPGNDVLASDDLYVATLFSLITAQMPDELLAQFVEIGERDADPRGYPARVAKAVRLTAHEHWALVEQQLQVQAAWARFFERYDAVLCPIQPTVAFAHDQSVEGPGHTAQYERVTMVDGEPAPYLHAMQWTGLITIADLSATAVPTGRLVDGMPVGLQIVGPRLEDRTPLRPAQLAERELGGWVEPRSLAAREA